MSKKWVIILGLSSTIVLALLDRCLHLLNPDHYYILSPDSHFFHWQAERILAGLPIPWVLHSGLTYPLAYIAKVLDFISPLSPSDALTITCKILPPVLAVISLIIIYLFAAKIYNRTVGLFSAFTWAILPFACFIGAAGYVDRDGLNTILIMIGAFIFFLSKDWHFKLGRLDVAWIISGLLLTLIAQVLMWQWEWIGGWILLSIMVCFVAVVFLNECLNESYRIIGLMESLSLSRQWFTILKDIMARVNWRPLILFIPLFILGNFIQGYPITPFSQTIVTATLGLTSGEKAVAAQVAELQGITPSFFVSIFNLLLIPMAIGFVIALWKRRQADLFCLSWFLILLFLSLFANRFIISAQPAVCLLSGIGITFLWSTGARWTFQKLSKLMIVLQLAPRGVYFIHPDSLPGRRLWRAGVVFLLVIMIFYNSWGYYYLGSNQRVAADNNWQDALIYLKDNTPEDARIMSWWDYGYWILDLTHRDPLVDNGYHLYTYKKLHDIGLVYFTSESSQVVQIMQKYECDYLILSRVEVGVLPAITAYGLDTPYGDGYSLHDEEMKLSLYYKILWEDFQPEPESGLLVVKRFPNVNPKVVILGLE